MTARTDPLPLILRSATPAEYSRIGDLAVEAYSGGDKPSVSPDSDYLEVVRDVASRAAPGPVLVAERGDEIVGTVTICLPGTSHAEISTDGEVEFRFLAVRPDAAGQGIGQLLTDAVMSFAAERGAARVVCSVIDSNEPAHRLYSRLGFQRAPSRDWTPVDGVFLQVYTRDVPATALG